MRREEVCLMNPLRGLVLYLKYQVLVHIGSRAWKEGSLVESLYTNPLESPQVLSSILNI